MSEEAAATGPLPVVDWLKGAGTDDPYLEGHKCGECGAVFLGERDNCSNCGRSASSVFLSSCASSSFFPSSDPSDASPSSYNKQQTVTTLE